MKMHFLGVLTVLGFAATVAAQGSAGGSQASCSSAQSWVSRGCYDNNNNGRHAGFTWQLSTNTADPKYYPGVIAGAMTVDICLQGCRGHGFRWAALFYGTECYCSVNFPLATNPSSTTSGPGTPLGSAPNTPTSSSACNSPCNGNNAEICGGGAASSLYYDPSFKDITPATQSPSSYAYVGCFNYVPPGPLYITLQTTSTSACQTYCGLVGYPFSSRSSSDLNTGDANCGCSSEIQAGLQLAESSCNTFCNGTSGAT